MSLAALATVLVFAHAGDIYRVDIRTHTTSRLVATPALEHSPASPPTGNDWRSCARAAAMRTSGLRRLTYTKGDVDTLGDDSRPTWSPDGTHIVFSSNRTGDGELWITNADGSGQKRLAGLAHRDDWAPAWSPDGSRIAFHSLGALGRTQLYTVRPTGGGLTRLGVSGQEPSWLGYGRSGAGLPSAVHRGSALDGRRRRGRAAAGAA